MLLHRRRAIIWYVFGVARVNSTGGGVVVKFDVFSLCYAVCLCCLHASNDLLYHSIDYVQSQQAVKLVVVGLGFVEQCWFRLFLGDHLQ